MDPMGLNTSSIADMVIYNKKAKHNLCNNGLIMVKIKLFIKWEEVDETDSTILRSSAAWKKLFTYAGLKLVKESRL